MATIDESMQENEIDERCARASWEVSQKNAQIIELNRQITYLKRERDLWKNSAMLLRGSFVPNTRDHPAIKEYNSCCEVYDPTNDYYEP